MSDKFDDQAFLTFRIGLKTKLFWITKAAHRRSVEVRVFEALLLACDWFVSPYDLPIETIFTGDWLNFYISIALTCCTHASVESSETSEPSW